MKKYKLDDFVRPHPHCCGVICIYMQEQVVEPERLNFAIQYALWREEGPVLLELTLTSYQIDPTVNEEWDDELDVVNKEKSLELIEEWGFELVSSFVNGNTGHTVHVFHKIPEQDQLGLIELHY